MRHFAKPLRTAENSARTKTGYYGPNHALPSGRVQAPVENGPLQMRIYET
jgi:hypothetical protein